MAQTPQRAKYECYTVLACNRNTSARKCECDTVVGCNGDHGKQNGLVILFLGALEIPQLAKWERDTPTVLACNGNTTMRKMSVILF